MKKITAILLILLPLSQHFSQDTVYVPGDHATIQAAINASQNGDVVLVAENTYYENINFKGKAITVASYFLRDGNESHIENTIINGSLPSNLDSGSVVYFVNGEDTTAILKGFTITGGSGTAMSSFSAIGAGGILIFNSNARIENNIIENNILNSSIYTYGAGLLIYDDLNYRVIIKNNIIRNNSCTSTDLAIGGGIILKVNGHISILNNKIMDNIVSGPVGSGGGIDVWGSINEVYIVSNLIKGNTVQVNNAGGGGIDVYNCTTRTPVIENNVIVDNYSSNYGGGVLVDLPNDKSFKSLLINPQNTTGNSDALAEQYFTNNTLYNNSAGVSGGGIYTHDMTSNIMNCILWGNTATNNPVIAGTVTVTYSDVEGGWSGTGNFSVYPQFKPESEFYFLGASPCIDAGNPDPTYFDVGAGGNPMLPAQGSLVNDMGHCGGPNSLWCFWDWPLPVELTSFTAMVQNENVVLNWTTSTETNNFGFEIERKILHDQNFGEWITIGFEEGYGTTTEPKEYSYSDDLSTTQASSLSYRLKQIDFDGSYEYSEEVLVDNPAPVDYALQQNYPNPLNPATTISYSLALKSQVELVLFNALGERVTQLVNEEKEAGKYSIKFNSAGLPSGLYIYRLQAADFVQVRKMMLLK